MKLAQYLMLSLFLVTLPQAIFGEPGNSSSYSNEEVRQINYILIIKKACDLHVPEYYFNTIKNYTSWRDKHSAIIQEIENSPAYSSELEKFKNNLKIMTAQQISRILEGCNLIADRLNENSKVGTK